MIKNTLLLIGVISLLSSCGGERTRKVQVQTEYGNMTFNLYNSTPKHRDNFIRLVGEGFYDGLLFHRIIDGFMIQGGDPESKNAGPQQRLGTGGPGYLIDAEIAAPHFKGTLAAARTGGPGNPDKKSSGSQFYIVHGRSYPSQELKRLGHSKQVEYSADQMAKYEEIGGTPNLDMEYSVFGEITDGMEVIDIIAAVQKGAADRPVKDVKMKIVLLN